MEAKDEPVATTATETPSSITSTTSSMTTTTKTTPPHTSTKPDNGMSNCLNGRNISHQPNSQKLTQKGIETPHPIQPEMVSNCSKFYWVKLGDKCEDIAGSEGIPVSDLVKWNPKAGEKCTGLWADTYACVSVIGYVRPTPTTPPNGVQTPSPTQKNMVANCNKFRWVYPGESCTDVATKAGVSVTDLARWNPNTGSQCTGLWADAYACVGVIPSVRLKTRWGGNCGGGVHDEVALEGGDGICVNTGCAVGGLEIAPEGYCPDGEVRISYWGGSACDGAWYGYGYASRGQCRTLWSGGYKFKSLYLRCAKKDDDCVTKGECTFEPEPTWNLC